MKYLQALRVPFFLICLAVLLWGTLRSSSPPDLFENSDKWLHLIAFFALGFSSQFAFTKVNQKLLWILLLLSAPTLELIQYLVQESRTFSWLDIAANLIGLIIAFIGWKLISKKKLFT